MTILRALIAILAPTVRSDGKWVTEKCGGDTPYCASGAEACSAIHEKDSCNPEKFIPFCANGKGYTCQASSLRTHYSVIESDTCIASKNGEGVAVSNSDCSSKGEKRMTAIDKKDTGSSTQPAYYNHCEVCLVSGDGSLKWTAVPASYSYNGSGFFERLQECTPVD